MSNSSWSWAVELMSRFLVKPARLQHLLERLPASMDSGTRRRCQFLLYGVVRHWAFLEGILDEWLRKRPRPGLRAALLVASFELMEDADKGPQIVDHAVRNIGKKYTQAERGLANAVLRKVSARMPERLSAQPANAAAVGLRYSHPLWLIERWELQFGLEGAASMAAWNQKEPELYALALKGKTSIAIGQPSRWAPYVNLTQEDWPAIRKRLDEAEIYIQNPGARLAPELLVGHFKEGRILDLCAAPGGKSLYLDRALGEGLTEIVALDLPGPRLERLKSNLVQFGSGRIRTLASDVFDLEPAATGLFEAVFLDAPCSNTGVMQRKPDVKWRLGAENLRELSGLQERMLEKAARFVGEKGLLVYSTCSIDGEENQGVVDPFLASSAGQAFEPLQSVLSLPWKTGHDGSGACIMRRR